MTDLRTALRLGSAKLAAADVESPRLDCELLLAHAHGVTRAQLLTCLREPLGFPEHHAYVKLLDRRAAREPLAYILGRKPFFDLDVIVDRRVLIPRPESEHLVELALALAPGLPNHPSLAIADVGTGQVACWPSRWHGDYPTPPSSLPIASRMPWPSPTPTHSARVWPTACVFWRETCSRPSRAHSLSSSLTCPTSHTTT